MTPIVTGPLVGRGKKSISRDFLGQISGKNGRFRGNFEGIFEAEFCLRRFFIFFLTSEAHLAALSFSSRYHSVFVVRTRNGLFVIS